MGGDLWLELKAFLQNPKSKRVISSQSTKVRLNVRSKLTHKFCIYQLVILIVINTHQIVGLHVKNTSNGFSSRYDTFKPKL